MPIILSSDGDLHPQVVEYLDRKKAENPNYRVLDVGGYEMAWAGKWTTAYLDIQGGEYVGDICYQETWDQFGDKEWDFVVCTHTLEDVRDPVTAIRNILRVAKAGFVAMPHKHSELSNIALQRHWVGYCHHRWVFTLAKDVLRFAAKWPVTSALCEEAKPGPSFLPWLRPSMGQIGELSFLWEGEFEYELIRGDFAGKATDGCDGILRMYRDEFAEGI